MKSLLLCCLLFLSFRHPALSQRTFGAKGGLNVSKQSGAAYKPLAGYQAGLFYRLPFTGSWALYAEVNFSVTGSRSRYITESMIQQQDFTKRYLNQKFGYVEVPVLLQYHTGPLYAGAGLAVSYLLFSRITHFDNLSGSLSGFKPFDLSANLLAGCRLSKHFDLNLRYSHGLRNIEQGILFHRKNRFVNLSLLYALKKGSR